MADLRKDVHGPGSMKAVEVVVLAYDNRVSKKDDVVTNHFLDIRIHPEDRRAEGQTQLALVSKDDAKSPSGKNNTSRYSAGQMKTIVEAAGTNVTDLTTQDGTVVGKIYNVKSDLMINADKEVILDSKTIQAGELGVGDKDGKDVRTRMFDVMRDAKAAKTAAKTTEAPAAEAAEATAEAPAAETTAEVVAEKPAPAKRAPRKRAPAKKAAEAEASAEEPGLG